MIPIGRLARATNPKAASTPTPMPMPAPGPVPAAEPLPRLLHEIAAVWRAAPIAGARPTSGGEAGALGGQSSPQTIAALAASLDLEVTYEDRGVDALGPGDFPCIVLVTSGAGRMMTGRSADGGFVGRAGGRAYVISVDQLRREAFGTVFLVRPRAEGLARETEPVAAEAPERSKDPGTKSAAALDVEREILDLFWHRKRKLTLQLLIAAMFSNLMLVALPIYSGLVYDRVIPHGAMETLWALSIGVVVALCLDLAVRAVRLKSQDALALAASADLQARLVSRLVEVRMTDAPRSSGPFAQRLREIEGLCQAMPQLVAGLAVDLPFLVLVMLIIWLNGGWTVVAPVVGVGVLFVIHHVCFEGSIAPMMKALRIGQTQANRVVEAIETLETVKVTRTGAQTLTRFERLYDEYAYASYLGRLWNGLAAYANMTVGQLMMVMVLVIGAYQVFDGAMTAGALSTCMLLVGRIISPVGALVGTLHKVQQSRRTLASLAALLDGKAEVAGDRSAAAQPPPMGAITFNAVSFAYAGRSDPQLEAASLTIRPGEKVAIIGRSGSGKSTLLKLMVRLIEPERGAVLIDGTDARQYRPDDVRRTIGYLGQVPGLVDDTLLTNLTLGINSAERDRFEAIVRLSGVADFASRHPQGYGMAIGPRGENLSGGERQSVGLARLLLGDHKVLVMDEPTAAMDTMLEARVVRDLQAALEGRTLVVATHRAPILDLADRLIWLDNGRIIADGPKAEVLRRLATPAA